MKESYVLYPHQLFNELLKQQEIKTVVLVEDPLFFTQFAFHKQKLVFHRASMKAFEHLLQTHGFKTIYIDSQDIFHTRDIGNILAKQGISKIHIYDLVDDWLEKGLNEGCKQAKISIVTHHNPGFYLSKHEIDKEFSNQDKFLMSSFYIKQRKRFDILVEEGKPLGGKWSFDAENRKKLPKHVLIPPSPLPNNNPFVIEAKKYITRSFSHHVGNLENFVYPITHQEAENWLMIFLKERFLSFGTFQDAISENNSLLFHSLLSPLLNTGLLTPRFVVKKSIDYANSLNIPLNSLEGFIRQIVGWREFVRGVYCHVGRQERTTNFWKHSRKLPLSFWNATTGILPIDNVITKVMETGYAHHIERLMIMSNFMLLCEIHPNDVYKWFMELFIDAYDWVMVPNVYGMGLYADGGMITTKPYISGSAYLLRMSNYPKGPWTEIWDSLYWNFVYKNQKVFASNPRCLPIASMLNKMDPKKILAHRNRAEKFFETAG